MKKKDTVNLEKNRMLFFQIGLVLAILLVIAVLEWSTRQGSSVKYSNIVNLDMEVEFLPIRIDSSEIKPPPPRDSAPTELIITNNYQTLDPARFQEFNSPIAFFNYMSVNTENQLLIYEEKIYNNTEIQPEFSGGQKKLLEFIFQNMIYPEQARKNNVQGKVYVKFVITAEGEVVNPVILRGITPELDAEALRIVKKFPRWKPAKIRNKTVSTWYILPIIFKMS